VHDLRAGIDDKEIEEFPYEDSLTVTVTAGMAGKESGAADFVTAGAAGSRLFTPSARSLAGRSAARRKSWWRTRSTSRTPAAQKSIY
jgi:hypothetical protein